jgi:hypothetical protein
MRPSFPAHRLPFAPFLAAFCPREVRPSLPKRMPGTKEALLQRTRGAAEEGGWDAGEGRQRGKGRRNESGTSGRLRLRESGSAQWYLPGAPIGRVSVGRLRKNITAHLDSAITLRNSSFGTES